MIPDVDRTVKEFGLPQVIANLHTLAGTLEEAKREFLGIILANGRHMESMAEDIGLAFQMEDLREGRQRFAAARDMTGTGDQIDVSPY